MPVEVKPRRTGKPETLPTPDTMHAAAIDEFGGPDVLTLHTLPVPLIEKDEVLIQVHTAGVGVWDADMREGWMPSGKVTFPLVLGSDGSGRVAAMGSHNRRFKVGEEVYGFSFDNPKGGFYAEYVAVPEERVAPIPRPLSLEQAGAAATSGLTALQGIDDALEVKRGETIVIHGASGAVGTIAVQFAKLREARVFATASGEDGMELVRRLGADAAAEGHRGDLAAAIRAFAPGGVDGVLVFAGGDALESCMDAVRPGGRVAYPHGVDPEPKKRPGIRFVAYDAAVGVREFDALNMAVEAVKLQVPIAARFPLAQASKAHERLAKGHVLGKIVLQAHK